MFNLEWSTVMEAAVRGVVWERPWGQVALMRRTKVPGREDFFTLPGGRREPGESDEACLLRELNEELGLSELSIGPLVATQLDHGRDGDGIETVFYLVSLTGEASKSGQLPPLIFTPQRTLTEIDGLYEPRWVAFDRLSLIIIRPNDFRKPIVAAHRQLVSGAPNR